MENEKQIIYVLTFMWFCAVVDFMLMMPFGADFMNIYNIQPSQFSLLVSAYSIAAGSSAFLATIYIDRYDRKKILMTAFFLFSLGSIFCSFAANFYMMFVARFITGAFGGILGCVTIAIISDLVPFSRRGKAMGVLNMAFGMASIVGIPLGLLISKYSDVFFPFRVIGVLGLIVFFFANRIIPSLEKYIRQESKIKFNDIKDLVLDKNILNALVLVFFLIVGHFMFISFVNPYLTENLKFTKNDTTLMYVVGGLCVALSSSYVGMQIDKIGKYKSFVILIILSFIPILAIAHLQRGSLVLSLVLCAMLFVFSSGRMMAAMTLLTGAPTEQQRSKFLAIRSAIIEFSEGIAVSIGGLILSKNQVDGTIENYSILSYITVVVGILCIFLAKRVKIREQD